MNTRAAVCRAAGSQWEIADVELADPGLHEVVVKLAFAGLCHSDESVRTGHIGAPDDVLEMVGATSMYPIVGGHEGSGIVESIGERVTTVAVGDHIAVSFAPSCGHCFWCASGRQHLCDMTIGTLAGPSLDDGVWRHHLDGQPVNTMAQLGTFAERTLCSEQSVIAIGPEVPLDVAAVVSCGIATGFGSSARRAGVAPGEVVVVAGCGGVGHGALLGAISAGARAIVAVDPVAFKRETALSIGATHTAESIVAATELVRELTHGRMADAAVLTPGILTGDMLLEALALVSKDGRVVVTGVARWDETTAQVSLYELAMSNKAILGSLFGSTSPRVQIPRILELYAAGRLPLDQLITQRYPLDDVGRGYQDMHDGRTIRGVLAFT
jgi:S-(hydroxymethyl)glutathione dehydrogenase/alcohol dehydrogenase